MNSLIYSGTVWHKRFRPREHAFHYPAYFFGLDLEELESGCNFSPIFGRSRGQIFSIRESDYLPAFQGTLRQRLQQVLSDAFLPDQVFLITLPRYFGYVFNPVNFYICLDQSKQIGAVVAEVSNTFGEKHIYTMVPAQSCDGKAGPFEFEKQFYVSPFFGMGGQYRLTVHRFGERVEVQVDLIKDGDLMFSGVLSGQGRPLGWMTLISTMLRYPVYVWLVMLRIEWQALLIFFRRKLPMYPKPELVVTGLYHSAPGLIHRLRLWSLRFFLCKN